MKKLLLLFIGCASLSVLAFSIQAPSGKYQNDCADENLKGSVKSCTEYYYDVYKKGNAIDSDYSFKIIGTFNRQGNLLVDILGNSSNKESLVREYDDLGRNTLTKLSSGEIISQSSYSFNKEHKLVEIASSGFILKTVYNKAGRIDTVFDITNSDNVIINTTCRYNKSFDLIEKIRYDYGGNFESKVDDVYDKNHHKVEEKTYYNSMQIGSTPNITKSTFAYDAFGNIIMERDSNERRIGGYNVYSIDPTDKNYKIFKCKYSNFDSHKNWLRQDMLYNDTIAKTVKKVIEYYP